MRSSLEANGASARAATRTRGAGGTIAGGGETTHTVARGQTLSHIAVRYRIPVRKLRDANRLRGNSVKAGQILKIPTG